MSSMLPLPGLQGLSPMKNTEGYFLLVQGSTMALQVSPVFCPQPPLQKLPLTGSPHHSLSKLANPRGVSQLLLSSTGQSNKSHKYCSASTTGLLKGGGPGQAVAWSILK